MLKLLVVQPTSLCNLDCSYCYVPDRQERRRLPASLLETLLLAVRRSDLTAAQSDLRVLWHAGEPLAAGIDFYREALEVTEQTVGDRFRVRHSLQTNATLVDDEWATLFRANDIAIGVSIDGPEWIHDANRKDRGGHGSFARVMRGIECLTANEIPIRTLSVLTAQSIACPDEMFDFFLRSSIRYVGFNVEEIEGPNLRSSLLGADDSLASARRRYRSFMSRFAELNRDNGWPIRVREFVSLGQLMEQLRASPTYAPSVVEHNAGAILTMTRDGMVSAWSPELASGTPGDPNRFVLGDIREVESVDALLSTDRARGIQAEIDLGVSMCRDTCGYFGVCGGGSPANKFYERGTFAATETLKCSLQTQELTEVILDLFGVDAAFATG